MSGTKGVERFKARMGGHIRESMGSSSSPSSPSSGSGGPLPLAPRVPSRYDGVTRPKEALTIEVDRLAPDPRQPRKDFDGDELAMLAESLGTRGQLQPIRVRWDETRAGGQGGWVIVSGERRWRAAKLAGLATITAIEAKGTPAAGDILEDQLVENCVRADLKPVEQARAFKELMDCRGYSGRQLAGRLNISHMSVQRALALLELPAAVREQVELGVLAPGTAYEVSRVADPAVQAEVARAAADGGLARAEVAELVRAVRARRPAPAARPAPVALDLGDGCTVTVRWRRAGGPTIVQALRKALRVAREGEKGERGERGGGDERAA